jgi:hypothetical protein
LTKGLFIATVAIKDGEVRFNRQERPAQEDDFRTFLGDFVAALPQIGFPAVMSL